MSNAEPLETGSFERSRPSTGRPLAAPVRLLSWLVKTALVIAMLMVLVFTVGQVFDRHLLKSTFAAHDQFARIGLVWLTFLGIAVGIRDRTNVRIELLNHLAPQHIRRFMAIAIDLVILATSILLVIVGVPLLEVGAFQAIMGTTLYYDTMYASLLCGLCLLIIFLVLRFADLLSGGRFNLDSPVHDDDHHD